MMSRKVAMPLCIAGSAYATFMMCIACANWFHDMDISERAKCVWSFDVGLITAFAIAVCVTQTTKNTK